MIEGNHRMLDSKDSLENIKPNLTVLLYTFEVVLEQCQSVCGTGLWEGFSLEFCHKVILVLILLFGAK